MFLIQAIITCSSRQGIVKQIRKPKTEAIQADLGMFTHIPVYSGIFTHIPVYSGIFKHIQTYTGIFRNHLDIFRTLSNLAYSQKSSIFRVMAYSKSEAYSELWHIQNFNTFRTRNIFRIPCYSEP